MDEVITCPECGGQSWVIGQSGTRCCKCNWCLRSVGSILWQIADNYMRWGKQTAENVDRQMKGEL